MRTRQMHNIDREECSQKTRVFVMDRDDHTRMRIATLLQAEQFCVIEAKAAEVATTYLRQYAVDIVLLDPCPTAAKDMRLLREFKQHWPELPLLVMSASESIDLVIEAMRAKADDYLRKPLEETDLLHRMHRLLQRTGSCHILRVADLQLDVLAFEVTQNGKLISLTPTEFNLLLCLMKRVDQTVTYQELAQTAQGESCARSLFHAKEWAKYHIYSLRRKLENNPSQPRYIHNIRGRGYKLSMESN